MPGALNTRTATTGRIASVDNRALVERTGEVAADIRQYVDFVALAKDQERGPLYNVMFELAVRNVIQRRQRSPPFGEEVRDILRVVDTGRLTVGHMPAEKTTASGDH